MFQSTDSTATSQQPTEIQIAAQQEPVKVPQHPYEVLSRLPANATPAQQDSAIQAVFHVENTHISTRPDTLGLPGVGKGQNLKEVNLPQYYRENFFSNDSLLHPELRGGLTGVSGIPVPYTVKADDMLTSLLIGCFIIALLAFSKSRRFIARQVKSFVHEPSALVTEVTETTNEFRFQFFLVLQTCLLSSVLSFLYTRDTVGDVFMLPSLYHLMLIFFAVYVGYFVLKELIYGAVNGIFFGKSVTSRWFRMHIFVVSAEGVALFPLVMFQAYFDLPLQNAVIYVGLVIILVRILLAYKAYVMIFKQKSLVLQIILYLCALELMPLLTLWGVLVMIVDCLKINI